MALDLYTDNPGFWRILLAKVYALAVRLRLWLFRMGVIKQRSLPVRIISVGNLVVGGTGKTPTVLYIARMLTNRGIKTAILSRGYQGKNPKEVNVVSDEQDVLMSPDQAGDEAYWLAANLPGIPVLTGRYRYALGRAAIERFGAQVLILDDGFQHLALRRDVNLLLLDAEKPWGNERLLPAGALREPKTQARRATAFLVTRVNEDASQLVESLKKVYPDSPVFLSEHSPRRLRLLNTNSHQPPSYLSGRRMIAVCGLARPELFYNTLVKLKTDLGVFIRWPDHYWPREHDLKLVLEKADELGVGEVVTTAKDAVKLEHFSIIKESNVKFWILDVELSLLDSEDALWRVLLPEES
jgi:tetraacyldisaccharide 4'-kinase